MADTSLNSKGTSLWEDLEHTCQQPEYKNVEIPRNHCIVRMSLKTMPRNNPRKSPKRHSERPGDLMKNLGDSRENQESWQVCWRHAPPESLEIMGGSLKYY